MKAPVAIVCACAAVAALAAACRQNDSAAPPAIPFAPLTDPALKDPDNPTKTFRVDLAEVEYRFPLSRTDLSKLTPGNIAALEQEKIDQIYGRITAGPIPDGLYESTLFFAQGSGLRHRIENVIGSVEGRVAGGLVDTIELALRFLWKDKIFDRERRIARTAVEDLAPLRALVEEPDTLPSVTIPRRGLLRFVSPKNRVWALFPAKLHCGQSLLDGRRESVIMDHNFNDDIEGYRASPDRLLGRGGLALRDEIRMVRPGFYLGRAYVGRVFLLNFTLLNAEVAEREAQGFAAGRALSEECWAGEQIRERGAAR